MKINYQRGENLKKKVGRLSTSLKRNRDSFSDMKKIKNRIFRNKVKNDIKHYRHDFLPIHKKSIWWECF